VKPDYNPQMRAHSEKQLLWAAASKGAAGISAAPARACPGQIVNWEARRAPNEN